MRRPLIIMLVILSAACLGIWWIATEIIGITPRDAWGGILVGIMGTLILVIPVYFAQRLLDGGKIKADENSILATPTSAEPANTDPPQSSLESPAALQDHRDDDLAVPPSTAGLPTGGTPWTTYTTTAERRRSHARHANTQLTNRHIVWIASTLVVVTVGSLIAIQAIHSHWREEAVAREQLEHPKIEGDCDNQPAGHATHVTGVKQTPSGPTRFTIGMTNPTRRDQISTCSAVTLWRGVVPIQSTSTPALAIWSYSYVDAAGTPYVAYVSNRGEFIAYSIDDTFGLVELWRRKASDNFIVDEVGGFGLCSEGRSIKIGCRWATPNAAGAGKYLYIPGDVTRVGESTLGGPVYQSRKLTRVNITTGKISGTMRCGTGMHELMQRSSETEPKGEVAARCDTRNSRSITIKIDDGAKMTVCHWLGPELECGPRKKFGSVIG